MFKDLVESIRYEAVSDDGKTYTAKPDAAAGTKDQKLHIPMSKDGYLARDLQGAHPGSKPRREAWHSEKEQELRLAKHASDLAKHKAALYGDRKRGKPGPKLLAKRFGRNF